MKIFIEDIAVADPEQELHGHDRINYSFQIKCIFKKK